MSTRYIKDVYQEPIIDIRLDILAFDLLKIILEAKLPIFIKPFLKHQSDNDDNTYNYLMKAFQYLLDEGYMVYTEIDQHKKASITKAGEQWLNDAPYDMPSHIRIPSPIIVFDKKKFKRPTSCFYPI